MIRTVLAFAAVCGLVVAQDLPNDVDQIVALAMKSHPDVLLAEAKVRQAEAELMQAKMKAAREAIEVWKQRRNLELDLRAAEKDMARKSELAKAGTVNAETLDAARAKFDRLRAEVADSQAVARFMLGVGLAPKPDQAPQRNVPAHAEPARPAFSDALAAKLSTTIDVFAKDQLLTEAVESITRKLGVNLLIDSESKDDLGETRVTVDLKSVPAVAALTGLFESNRYVLVERGYGLLLIGKDKAATMRAATVPSDLPLVE